MASDTQSLGSGVGSTLVPGSAAQGGISMGGTDGRRSSLEMLTTSVHASLVQLGTRLRRRSGISKQMMTALAAVELMQLLSLAFWPGAQFPWSSSVSWLASAALTANWSAFALTHRSSAALLFLATGLTGVMVCFSAVALSWSTLRGRATFHFLLRPLNSLVHYSPHVLLIPTATMLPLTVHCAKAAPTVAEAAGMAGADAPLLGLGGTCGSASHAFSVLLAGIAVVGVGASAVLGPLLVWNPSPTATEALARPHGRVHAAASLVKLALALLVSGSAAPHAMQDLLATAITFGALALLTLHLRYLPCFDMRMNALAVGQASLLLWTAACLVLGLAEGVGSASSGGITLLFGSPLVILLTQALMAWRRRVLRAADIHTITSPFLLELRFRLESHEATKATLRAQRVAEELAEASALAGTAPGPSGAVSPTALSADLAGAGIRPALGTHGYTDSLDGNCPRWQRLELQYHAALRRLPTNPWLHAMLAQAYKTHGASPTLTQDEWRRATSDGAPLDVECAARFERELYDETQQESGGGASLDPGAYMAFESHMQAARSSTIMCLRQQLRFWNELMERASDLERLFRLGCETSERMDRAQRHYEAALRINGSSVDALRQFAAFLMNVRNDPASAQDLLSKADVIEDEQAAMMNADEDVDMGGNALVSGAEVDIFSSTAANFVISGKPKTVGRIINVNSPACKLVGMKKKQLMNKNISVILPPPFPPLHDGFLLRYIQRREGRYMNNTRPVFVQHSSGFIRAALLTLRESTESQAGAGADDKRRGSEGSSLAFMGALKPLNLSCQLMLVDDDGMVLAVSEGMPDLAGISLAQVRQRSVRIEDLLPGRSGSDDAQASPTSRVQSQGGEPAVPRLPWQAPTFQEVLHTSVCSFRVNGMAGPSYQIWIMKVDRVGPAREAGVEESTSAATMELRERISLGTTLRGPRSIIKGPPASDAGRIEGRSIMSDTPAGTHHRATLTASDTSFSEGSSASKASDGIVIGASRRKQDQELDMKAAARVRVGSAGAAYSRPAYDSNEDGGIMWDDGQVEKKDAGSDSSSEDDDTGEDEGLLGLEEEAADEGQVAFHKTGTALNSDLRHRIQGLVPSVVDAEAARRAGGQGDEVDDGKGAKSDTEEEAAAPLLHRESSLQPVAESPSHYAPVAQLPDTVSVDSHTSRNSKAHSSSRGSSSAASSNLRALHSVVKRKNARPDHSLSKLRRLLCGLLLAITVLAAGIVTVTHVLLGSWYKEMQAIHVAELRVFYTATLALSVSTINLHAREGLYDADEDALARRHLRASADEMLRVHETLFNAASIGSKDVELPIRKRISDSVNLTDVSNLWSAGIDFASHALQVAEFPKSDFNLSSGSEDREQLLNHVFYVLENDIDALLPAMSEASANYYARSTRNLEDISMLVGIAMLAAAVPLLASMVFGYIPTVRGVEDTKRRILLLFLDIPRGSVRSIIADRRQQLEAAEGDDDDEGDDLDGAPVAGDAGVYGHTESEHEMEARGHAQDAGHVVSSPVNTSGGGGAASPVQTAAKDGASRLGQRRRGQYRSQRSVTAKAGSVGNTHASLLRNLGKFSVGYFLAIVFFGAAYLVVNTVISGCEDAAANVLVAGDRMAAMRISHLLHRNYISRGGPLDPSSSEADGSLVGSALQRELEHLVTLENALMYGSTAHGTKGLKSKSGMETQTTLLLQDGCIGPWAAEEAEQQRLCPTFRKGAMAHGAHAAVSSYVEAVRNSMAFRDSHGREATFRRSPATDDVEQLDLHYLTRALVYSAQLYDSAAEDHVDSTGRLLWALVGCYALCNAAIYSLVYRLLIEKLDQDLRHTRTMLLLLPPSLARAVTSIREYIKEARVE